MILIADSGSTKTDWTVISNQKQTKVKTLGLNPAILSTKELKNRIINSPLMEIQDKVTQIYFYGAGCGTIKPTKVLEKILVSIFKNAIISVVEDTLAAIHSVTSKPAIVCILGTGSNCTYFNGKESIQKVESLGYSIMDEASGNYYGKELLKNYFYHKMPINLALQFEKEFLLDSDEVKYNLYQSKNPNAYLASFTPFLIQHKKHEFMQNLIFKGLHLFIENQILQHTESKKLPIHFVGSIAHFLKDEIKIALKNYQLTLGKIEQKPMHGLIKYHLNN
jgi:N-acetylglucosamine kinase-like BadF-type ATPase